MTHHPDPAHPGPSRPIARIGRDWWLLAGFLLPLLFIAVALHLVIDLGHDSVEQSATTGLVREFNRLGLSLRDFEVPLGDQPAKLSWAVHYRIYRSAVDSMQHMPLVEDAAGYLTGIEASVRRLEPLFDHVLQTRATHGDLATAERDYRAEIDNGLEVIKGATDVWTQRLSIVAARVNQRWRQLLWLTVVSSLLATGFGVVLLLYRRTTIQRQRAEAALRESDERVRLLLDSTGEAIFGIDLEGRCTFANAACIEVLGYRQASDLHGRVMHDLIHTAPPGGDVTRSDGSRLHHVDRPPVHGLEAWMRRADGSTFPAACSADQIVRRGELVGRVITFVDITEQRRIEAERRHAQKLESVGLLAGGVAHDFNNLLTAIDGYTSLALETLPQGGGAWNDLQEVRNASQRAAALTRQLLAFARKQVTEPKILDLNELLERVAGLLRPLVGPNLRLEVRRAETLGRVRADPGQIEQVVVNLVVNARDAMPDGGRITVEARDVDLDDVYAQEHTGVASGRYVMVAVSDTGVGMSKEVRARLFEPFFTTKEAGKGTGLGLATCYGIAKQHGGNIWCYSEVGRGTTFKVYLPRADGPVEVVAPMAAAPTSHGSETVLVVEDEPAIRRMAVRSLTKAGYAVREAGNGREALTTVATMTDGLDLLVTDLMMPDMGGIELSRRLREERPNLCVLFTSGYSETALPTQENGQAPMMFLEKPFTPNGLLRHVRAALDGTDRP